MVENIYKRNKVAGIVSASLLFILARPYFTWNGFLGDKYVLIFLSFVLAGLFLFKRKKMDVADKRLFVFLLVSAIMFTFYGGSNIYFFISILPAVFLPFGRYDFSKTVFHYLLSLFSVVFSISLLFWIGAIFGIVHPMSTLPPLNPLKDEIYYVFPLLVSNDPVPLRFFGPFDEPGVVGTISAVMLCIEKFSMKDWKSIVLLVAGLCSLSFFFYVIIAVYFVVLYSSQKQYRSRAIGVILLVIVGVLVVRSVPVLNETLGARFEWNSEKGSFAGDNRISMDVVEMYASGGGGNLWFGVTDKEGYQEAVQGSSSIINVVMINGLAFLLMYLAFFVFYGSHYKTSNMGFLLYILVLLAALYQRPNIFDFLTIYLFTYFARSSEPVLESNNKINV